MIREYIEDRRRAAKVKFDDPVLQKVIQLKHWEKETDDQICKKLGMSRRELKIYLWAYEKFSKAINF